MVLVGLAVVVGVILTVRMNVFSHENASLSIDEYKVKTVNFEIVIPTSGELEADEKIEVRNKVESRTTVKWIIDEGSYVKAGDPLLELASEDIERRIDDMESQIETQKHEVETAESEVTLQEDQNASAEQAAQVKRDMAVIELEKWRKGDYKIRMNELNLAIEKAKRNNEQYTREYEQSIILEEKGFISESQLEEDGTRVLEANAELIKANLNKDIYEMYTRIKEEASRKSDLEQATDELERTVNINNTRLKQKEGNANFKRDRLDQSNEDMKNLVSQLNNCRVTAPIDGLVIYGTTGGRRWWRSEDPLQIGQDIYPNQLFFTLPDTSTLVALVKVHESQAGLLNMEMPATVRVDAQPELSLTGTVQKVGVMAEQSFGTQVREYSVEILIDGENEWELKPAMRCKASIFLGKLDNVIGIPLQAVFTSKRQHYVWLRNGSKYVKHTVTVGKASETMIEIKDGLKPGQTVLLREPLPGEVGS